MPDLRLATAEWADPALVEEKYLYRDGDVWLGRSANDHLVPLGYCDDRHVCVVSGSRGGKGTTSIVNNLVLWPGSICVLDPKGENATITAARRGKGSAHCTGLGQVVQVLDPFKAAQVDDSLRGRFNPLDTLDPNDACAIDEAGRIADAIVVIHDDNDPFWDESARSMVRGLILHVLTSKDYEGRRNLITVRNLITRGDAEWVEALRQSGELEKNIPSAHTLLWKGLRDNTALNGVVAGIGDTFNNMLQNSPKQYESVLQVANRNTEFIDSPGMQRCLEASDFQLGELKTRPGGMSLYLCLPQMYMGTHHRWLRMMIGLTTTEMEKVRGRPATGYPILMLLDEFAGLQRMQVIENAVAQIAGYGVKMFFVLQSLEQLKALYKDNWETFLANSGLKVFFCIEDNFTRDYVSKLIGETEVMRDVRSESETKGESESTSHSTSTSRSETHGTSSSTTTSVSDGTNSSISSGISRGINTALSISKNLSYVQGMIFKHFDKSVGLGNSQTEGKSEGWNEGKSQGVSHGTSTSQTVGTSDSVTTGTSETDGTTRGTSESSTEGTSETIQKRPLITSDEIGQVFARIDDKTQLGYPGLALVVISGARPLPLMRVNYFEDYKFMGLFDPAPDFPFNAPKDLCVDGSELKLSLPEYGLKVGAWTITAGNIAASNDGAASIVTGQGKNAAFVRVPRNGLVTAVEAKGADIPAAPLFSLRYYEDGAALIDPFAELRALCAAIAKQREDEKRRAEERARRRKREFILALATCCVLLIGIIWGVIAIRRPAPFTVGKIKFSRFAGLKPGDTPARVASLYGPGENDSATAAFYLDKSIFIIYQDGVIRAVAVGKAGRDQVRSRTGDDVLLDLLGQPKDAIIALLGPSTPVHTLVVSDSWNLAGGRHAGRSGDGADLKTLAVGFDSDGRCSAVVVNW